jgi:hypothetical protein
MASKKKEDKAKVAKKVTPEASEDVTVTTRVGDKKSLEEIIMELPTQGTPLKSKRDAVPTLTPVVEPTVEGLLDEITLGRGPKLYNPAVLGKKLSFREAEALGVTPDHGYPSPLPGALGTPGMAVGIGWSVNDDPLAPKGSGITADDELNIKEVWGDAPRVGIKDGLVTVGEGVSPAGTAGGKLPNTFDVRKLLSTGIYHLLLDAAVQSETPELSDCPDLKGIARSLVSKAFEKTPLSTVEQDLNSGSLLGSIEEHRERLATVTAVLAARDSLLKGKTPPTRDEGKLVSISSKLREDSSRDYTTLTTPVPGSKAPWTDGDNGGVYHRGRTNHNGIPYDVLEKANKAYDQVIAEALATIAEGAKNASK